MGVVAGSWHSSNKSCQTEDKISARDCKQSRHPAKCIRKMTGKAKNKLSDPVSR